jgi:carbonic anhydrase
MADWNYKRSDSWGEKYPKCRNKNKSPINIDTSTFDGFKNRCDIDCRLSISYTSSECYVTNINRTPTIFFNKGSIITYNKENLNKKIDANIDINNKNINSFRLKKATIHSPSMHTINNEKYDLEVLLYHYSMTTEVNSTMNNNDMKQNKDLDDDNDGGVIISLLYKSGNDAGDPNDFFSQIMNNIPIKRTKKEVNIVVDKDWGPKLLLPKTKSFFSYDGCLPMPPCDSNWVYIVFEEVGIISKTLLEGFRLVFNFNNTKTQRLNGRSISYNSNPKLHQESVLEINNINDTINQLKNKKEDIIEDLPYQVPDFLMTTNEKEYYANKLKNAESNDNTNNNNNGDNNDTSNTKDNFDSLSWYKVHKVSIKSSILFITFILFIMLSYFIAKYLITSDILPNFFIKIKQSDNPSPKKNAADDDNNDNNDN